MPRGASGPRRRRGWWRGCGGGRWTRRRRGAGRATAGRLLSIGRCRRDVDEAFRRLRPVGTWLVLRTRDRRSAQRRHYLCLERCAVTIERWWKNVGAAARFAWRRRLSRHVGVAG